MPRTPRDIESLLPELDAAPADAFEDQDLNFKEWPERSREKAVDQVVEMAVYRANGGGGTVVFGVRDRVIRRAAALLGVYPRRSTSTCCSRPSMTARTRGSHPSLRTYWCGRALVACC